MNKRISLDELEQIRYGLYNCDDVIKKNKIYKAYLHKLRKLAYSGNAESQFHLAVHYEDMSVMGYPNPFHSISKKFYWYTKSCNAGYASACNNLADMYERGEGCEQNIKKALELYKKAADMGNDLAKKNYKLTLKQIKQGKYKL
jgi:TPR repeat protein